VVSSFDRISSRWGLRLIVAVVVYTAFVVAVTIGFMKRTVLSNKDAEIRELRYHPHVAQAVPKPVPKSDPKETSHGVLFHEDSVFAGSSVTSSDGRCRVLVSNIVGESVDLTVIVDSDSPRGFSSVHPGSQMTVGDYLINLRRVRGDLADLTISKPY
jgi:hypothetical protein